MHVSVVSHTHWDREWYHGAGRFRQRLVALVDELLDAPAERRVPFLLDGQAIVLEDYLAVRPERADAVAAALREGWLEAGPWYVLADGLVPGGESLARNLLAGRRILRRLGAAPPPVLYSPDTFGHAAAMPAVAAGFGCPVAIVWRGYGGARWPEGDTAVWGWPDGSAVLLYHLPPSGYEVGSSLPADGDAARRWWDAHREVVVGRARLDLALLPNGADHHALQESADEALSALQAAAAGEATVARDTLAGFARELACRAAHASLPAVGGELRDSYGYAWTLGGTLATRARQKRDARLLERLLIRDVEPWLALASAGRQPHARRALDAAWRTLLRCHPHDTLCGCSIDAVARQMDARLESGTGQAVALREAALHSLVGHDAVRARTRGDEWQPALVVRNAAARPRAGVVEAELDAFVADVPVGPGSRRPARVPASRELPVVGDGGALVQVLASETVHDLTESPRHYPDCDLVRRTRALLWLHEPVAALGTLSLPLGSGSAHGAARAMRGPAVSVRCTARTLDNGAMTVGVDEAGRVSVVAGARRVEDLLGIESVGDVGDTYTHSPVGEPESAWAFAGARLEHAGPLRGTLALRWVLQLPRSRTRVRPAARRVAIPITVRLSLDAASPFLRIAVSGDNRARDHRLRLRVRTGVAGSRHHADAAFGPVARGPLDVPAADQRAESVPATAPLHRHVMLHDATMGATVLSDGLAEYEATTDGDVLVTLVRAVGELSRNDLPERDGHAGWPAPTPEAQSPGPFEATLAFLPHGPRAPGSIALVERVADDLLAPLRAHTLRSALRLPAPTAGPRLDGDAFALSAVKPAEDDPDAIVVRCVNLLDEPAEGRWVVGPSFRGAARARLDETLLEETELHDGEIRFTARPREIVTYVLRRG